MFVGLDCPESRRFYIETNGKMEKWIRILDVAFLNLAGNNSQHFHILRDRFRRLRFWIASAHVVKGSNLDCILVEIYHLYYTFSFILKLLKFSVRYEKSARVFRGRFDTIYTWYQFNDLGQVLCALWIWNMFDAVYIDQRYEIQHGNHQWNCET